ncbi:MFS transporter [Neobacillus drentensis]|uniref:MFS transporter n=1 Tax=Neobacillus drentensis TaxID=220684 RepID=UPI0008253CE3|nr:MFS transporter [Neobacillus drentensis]
MKNNRNDKLLNSQYIAINLITFIFFFADYILITTIPLYALEIGGNASTAGAFIFVISTTALVLRPIMGNLMDAKTRKLIILIGTIALALASLFYGLVVSITSILVLAILHGLSASAITTSAPTVVADVTPASRLAEGISMFGVATNLTIAVGPLASLYLINAFSYSITFNVAFVLVLLSIVLTFLINYEKKEQNFAGERIKTKKKINIKTLFEKTALKPSIYQLFLAFGLSAILTFIPIYGKSRGVDNIGLFFTFYAASAVIVSFITGKLVHTYGVRKVFIAGIIMQLITFLFLAFAYSLPLMITAALLYGFGSGSGFAIVSILAMESVAPERRGAANATIFAAMDIGIAVGSIVLGVISTKFGFTVTFILTASIMLVDIIVFSILHKEQTIRNVALEETEVL